MKYQKRVLTLTAIITLTIAFLLPVNNEAQEPNTKRVSVEIPDHSEKEKPTFTNTLEQSASDSEDQKVAELDTVVEHQAEIKKTDYVVKVGDTLSKIFSDKQIPYRILHQIMESDENHLKLDMIKPGDHLEFAFINHELQELVFHESLVERSIYRKEADEGFSYRFEEQDGRWEERVFTGTIDGSFSHSAHKLGLSSNQIGNITQLLSAKVNFSKHLRAGDEFSVLINQQYLGTHLTGNSEIRGISLSLRGRDVEAFLAPDGRFYDRDGESLEQAFNRYPIDEKYRRVTSHFNPRRKHPVTGRIRPHNGTDFATPVGAPIYSTGDGRVTAVKTHRYAGKYIVIEHNGVYKTRYLHLHKSLVKKGQRVKRGQKIALAGATGRLTGPHLHFEVLVRNKPVDPLKVKIPLAKSISKQDKQALTARISEFDEKVALEMNASNQTKTNTSEDKT